MTPNAIDFMRGMNHFVIGDIDAWMKVNADNRAWNACVIVKDESTCVLSKTGKATFV